MLVAYNIVCKIHQAAEYSNLFIFIAIYCSKYEYTKLSHSTIDAYFGFLTFLKEACTYQVAAWRVANKRSAQLVFKCEVRENKSLMHYITDALDVLITIEEPILP